MSRRRATAGLLAAALLLGGCAVRPPEPAIDWQARDQRLRDITSFGFRGRIAVRHDGGGGQGDLRWEQEGQATRIRVSGPFGAGAYEIRWDPAMLTINSRDGEFSRAWTGADAAEQFLSEQLGWSFPAASGRYWLLGLADPAFPAEEIRAADGRPASLAQNGWTVSFERFVAVEGLEMPARIVMESPRARLRLVIDQWRL